VPSSQTFHAYLVPDASAPNVLAQGPVKPGPCARPIENCATFTVTGSFTVEAHLLHLPPGIVPTLTIPVVDGTGSPAGTRALTCPPADETGRTDCNGLVTGAGLAPQVGGIVVLSGGAATPTATTTPTTPAPANNVAQIAAGLASEALAGVPCAVVPGQQCAIVPNGTTGPSGGATVDGSMSVALTVPAGIVPAGAVANAFFATTAGVENVPCALAAAGVATRCTGRLAGDALLGSTVRVFAGGVQVATGTVVGPGVPPLLPPAPPVVLPPPPSPLAPLPPFGGPGQPEVPVIPEAGTLVLLASGLAALGALGARRRGR